MIKKNNNILILYNCITHYRIPVFNELGKEYKVTIIHSGKKIKNKNDLFKEVIVPSYQLGPFIFQPNLLTENLNHYDVIIGLADIRWFNILLTMFLKKKSQKFIYWGAWLTSNNIANYIRLFLINHLIDCQILYCKKTRDQFLINGAKKEKLFVANNTIDVGSGYRSYESKIKNKIIFVGSLDPRKQLNQVINAFKNVIEYIPNGIDFVIIGEGFCKENLESQVKELGLTHRIFFKNNINDFENLKRYYKESIFAISYGQAGLSVLQAFGFGVPFITKKESISGGEKYNIKNGENGFLIENSKEDLQKKISSLCNDINYAKLLGEKAYNYYQKYCTIHNMAQGIKDAIQNTRFSKIDEFK